MNIRFGVNGVDITHSFTMDGVFQRTLSLFCSYSYKSHREPYIDRE